MSGLIKSVANSLWGFAAKHYQASMSKSLAAYGLKYHDILIEFEDVQKAVGRSEPELISEREKRIKRAFDCSLKHKTLPYEYQEKKPLDVSIFRTIRMKGPAMENSEGIQCTLPTKRSASEIEKENGENTKKVLMHQLGQHHYAIATTDTAFRHMLSPSMGSDACIVISLLNCFVPAFREDPIVCLKEAPVAIPALMRPKEKQTFMELHVISKQGTHYIIEMQARRHVMFDERALFYACSTYERQLSEHEVSTENWYLNLKPVIALQVLDYDTNRIHGLKSEIVDTSVDRVKGNPLKEDHFIKHYVVTDKKSGQEIDYLQMVQVELPRAEIGKKLFPPQSNFNLREWWVSILQHAQRYTSDEVKRLYQDEKVMPEEIYRALNRLDLQQWNPQETKEYFEDLSRMDLYATTLKVEREEVIVEGIAQGKVEGIAQGKVEVARAMKAKGMLVQEISECTGLDIDVIESLK